MEAQFASQLGKDVIPLMTQAEYVPSGWLSLLVGTRRWYAFWSGEEEQQTAETEAEQLGFETRVEALVAEIGERGRGAITIQGGMMQQLSEAVPPLRLQPVVGGGGTPKQSSPRLNPTTPLSAVGASRCTSNPHHNLVSNVTSDRQRVPTGGGYSPSMHSTMMSPRSATSISQIQMAAAHQMGLDQSAVAQLDLQRARSTGSDLMQLVDKMRAERVEMRADIAHLRATASPAAPALAPAPAPTASPAVAGLGAEALSPEQVEALHARIEALHTASLLPEAQYHLIEDLIADWCDQREAMAPQIITAEMVNAASGAFTVRLYAHLLTDNI